MKRFIVYFTVFCFALTFQGMAMFPAAIAEALASTEESSAPVSVYSKEDLQAALLNIKDNLQMLISPNQEDLDFLGEVKDELAAHVTSMQNAVEEIMGAFPDFYIQDFEDEIQDFINLINGLNSVIDSPSIEYVNKVLELLEALDPEGHEVQREILNIKPELPTRTVDTRVNVFEKRPIKYIGYDETEADLAETDEILITPAIKAKAAELSNNFIKIYSWVKNNIDYEPYYGSSKGSVGTLIAMAGNDCDQASLLIALLRAAGIPAKYIRGDKELTIEDLMNWVGVKMPDGDVTLEEIIKRQEAAVAIMRKNKIPIEAIYDLETGEIESVIFDHISVALYVGQFWGLVDPSLKTYVYTEGVGGLDISKEDIEAFANAAINFNESYDILSVNQTVVSDFLQEQVNALNPSLTLDEILGKREILVSQKIIPPLYLARGLVKDERYAEESSEMWDDLRYKVEVTMPGGNQYVASLSTLAGKRFSLVYKGAYPSHQAHLDSIGGIGNLVYPYTKAIQLIPVLQVDGETVATGSIVWLCRGQSLKVSFLRPGTGGVWEDTNKYLYSGDRYGVTITTQKTSFEEVLKLAEALKHKVDQSGLSGTDQMTDDMRDDALYLSGKFYFALVDEFSDLVSKSLNVISIGHISMAYVCNEIKPVWKWNFWRGGWYIDHIAKAGGHIDVVRNVKCATSTTGNRDNEVSWMRFIGAISTNMEHAMLKALYGIEAVSTGKIFAKANESGIDIHVLDNPETLKADLALISAPAYIKNYVRNYVNAGYTVMIPQRAVSVGRWSGHGWMAYDPDTGSAGYMICGGLNNEITIINGGSLTEAIDDAIDDFILFLSHAVDIAKAFVAPAAIMITAGIIMYAALAVSVAALPLAVTIPTSTFLWVVGLSLASAATTSFLMLLVFLSEASVRLRRRKYAYAYA